MKMLPGAARKCQVPGGAAAGQQLRIADETPLGAPSETPCNPEPVDKGLVAEDAATVVTAAAEPSSVGPLVCLLRPAVESARSDLLWHAQEKLEHSNGSPSGSRADLDMGADEHWVREAAESAALEKLRSLLGEQVRTSDEMQSLVRSVGCEARCFVRYLRLHSVSFAVRKRCIGSPRRVD